MVARKGMEGMGEEFSGWYLALLSLYQAIVQASFCNSFFLLLSFFSCARD